MISGDNDDKNDDVQDKTSIVQSDTFKVRLAEAGQAPPCLVLLVGPAADVGRQWPIEDTDRIIGRSAQSSHIHVGDKSISKSHAKLTLNNGEVSILDLGSTNKTVINGQVLTPLKPVKLGNNDQIKTGNVIFKFLEQGNIETVSAAQAYDRAQTDALTGIYNRGALDAQAEELFKKANLLGVPFSVIAFDIDHFKKANDDYGHAAGDYVLKELAQVIRDHLIRENDFFARYGGEEFCILLLGGHLQQAEEIAQRVRQTIESHPFEYQGTKMAITISLGVATKKPDDEKWEDIYARADKALYASKHAGRNQVTVYGKN